MSSLGWVQECRPNSWRRCMPKENGPTHAGQDVEARAEADLAKARAIGSVGAAAAFLRELKAGARLSGDQHPAANEDRGRDHRDRSRSPRRPFVKRRISSKRPPPITKEIAERKLPRRDAVILAAVNWLGHRPREHDSRHEAILARKFAKREICFSEPLWLRSNHSWKQTFTSIRGCSKRCGLLTRSSRPWRKQAQTLPSAASCWICFDEQSFCRKFRHIQN